MLSMRNLRRGTNTLTWLQYSVAVKVRSVSGKTSSVKIRMLDVFK